MMKNSSILLVLLVCVLGAYAEDIVVSWTSNGVLKAVGMEPGSTCTVEWTSNLVDGFISSSSDFGDFLVDSNGIVTAEVFKPTVVPMFFRVNGMPKKLIPEGMIKILDGTNSGTDPDSGDYSVTVSSFYMDCTEVTKAQWDTVYNWAMAHNYSFDNVGSGKDLNHPVQTVNWYDCVKWCNARSQMEDKVPCYTVGGSIYKTGQNDPDCNFDVNGYRLPTSDEWEYAARGGLHSKRFPWGDTITHSRANYFSKSSYSYDISSTRGYHPLYAIGDEPYTSSVGSFSSNGYGLYDMSGSVWEWCNTSSGSYRCLAGGGWYDYAYYARCDSVIWPRPVIKYYGIGFRTVRR